VVIVNGCPKSGTHAVMSMLSKMGLTRVSTVTVYSPDEADKYSDLDHSHYVAGHIPAKHDLTSFLVVTIFRDPRNVLTSYCRYRKKMEDAEISIPEAIADFWGAPFVSVYRSYLRWREPGRSVCLRYEDLPLHQVGNGAGLYPEDNDYWNTHTGSPSDWRRTWDRAAKVAWKSAGGPELLKGAGYG
jgi:hypothetical protein